MNTKQLKILELKRLTDTQRGFISITKYKTLLELPYDYSRCHEYNKENHFGAVYHVYKDYDQNENPLIIRALYEPTKANWGGKWITREQYKLLKDNKLI